MEKFILFMPVIAGVVLNAVGIFLYLNRKKFGIHVTGTVTGIAKSQTKYARVKVSTEAPVVKYEIDGQSYTAASARFYPEGTTMYKKGKSISIRVSRKNYRNFVPEENGGTAEKIFICCGTFMIIAFFIMFFKYY